MSEQNTTPPAAPEIPAEVIARIQADAVAKATEAAQKTAQNAEANAINAVVQKLTGNQPKPEDTILQAFLDRPQDVLKSVAEAAKNEALQEFKETLKEKEEREKADRAQSAELARASREVFESRPDISTSKEAKELLDTYFMQTDPSLPAAERVKDAVRRYDLMIEKISGEKAEDRIKKAASPTSSASAAGSPQPVTAYKESEIARDYNDRAMERYRKRFPGVVLPR